MNSLHYTLLAAAFLSLSSFSSAQQVTVVEAGSSNNAAQAGAGAGNAGNEIIMTLYLQLETLQQEVQTLRGQNEELAHQLKQMQQEQWDRYLDLDRRLSLLTQGDSPAQPAPADENMSLTETALPQTEEMPSPTSPNVTTTSRSPFIGNQPVTLAPDETEEARAEPQLSDQELYRTALNLLLEESRYEDSILLFQQYLRDYPAGRYVTNAYYWLGEAYILVEQYNPAKDAFDRVIKGYPEDPKAPGAMLKLGVVYEQMGDVDLARQMWQELAARYPDNASEIRAASDYLRRAGQ